MVMKERRVGPSSRQGASRNYLSLCCQCSKANTMKSSIHPKFKRNQNNETKSDIPADPLLFPDKTLKLKRNHD